MSSQEGRGEADEEGTIAGLLYGVHEGFGAIGASVDLLPSGMIHSVAVTEYVYVPEQAAGSKTWALERVARNESESAERMLEVVTDFAI